MAPRKKSLRERLKHEAAQRAAATRKARAGRALPSVPLRETRVDFAREEFGYTLGALVSGAQEPETQEEQEWLARVLAALARVEGKDIQLTVHTRVITEEREVERAYARILRWTWTRQDVGQAIYSAINATLEWAYREFGELANIAILCTGLSIAELALSEGDRALEELTEEERAAAEEETERLRKLIEEEERRERRKKSKRAREAKAARAALKEKRAKLAKKKSRRAPAKKSKRKARPKK